MCLILHFLSQFQQSLLIWACYLLLRWSALPKVQTSSRIYNILKKQTTNIIKMKLASYGALSCSLTLQIQFAHYPWVGVYWHVFLTLWPWSHNPWPWNSCGTYCGRSIDASLSKLAKHKFVTGEHMSKHICVVLLPLTLNLWPWPWNSNSCDTWGQGIKTAVSYFCGWGACLTPIWTSPRDQH